MINPTCDIKSCGKPLTSFGAIVLSPSVFGLSIKLHVCIECYFKSKLSGILKEPHEASIPAIAVCLHVGNIVHSCGIDGCHETILDNDCSIIAPPNGRLVIIKDICYKHYKSMIAPLFSGCTEVNHDAFKESCVSESVKPEVQFSENN